MKELIFNQRDIPKEQWRYGFRSSAATGCGWIATHNALRLMGYPSEPERLIRYFERRLPLLNGNFGIFLPNVAAFFQRQGFRVRVRFRRKIFDETAKNSDVCILFYFWHQDWKLSSHYAAVRYRNGMFTGYHTYSNSVGEDVYGSSLGEFLERKGFSWPVLIAIADQNSQ